MAPSSTQKLFDDSRTPENSDDEYEPLENVSQSSNESKCDDELENFTKNLFAEISPPTSPKKSFKRKIPEMETQKIRDDQKLKRSMDWNNDNVVRKK